MKRVPMAVLYCVMYAAVVSCGGRMLPFLPGAEGVGDGAAAVVQVLRDISTPDEGLYSVRDPMETRLSYVRWQMDNILSDPTIKVSMLSKGTPLALGPSLPCSAPPHQPRSPGDLIEYIQSDTSESDAMRYVEVVCDIMALARVGDNRATECVCLCVAHAQCSSQPRCTSLQF